MVAGDGTCCLDGEPADAWRLIDLGQAPPVGQRQRLDRFRQIVRPEDFGSVNWELVVDAGPCVIRNPDRAPHLVAVRASSSDLANASGSRSTAFASDASDAGERGRAATASRARAAARSGSTAGMVSVGSVPSTLSHHPDTNRHGPRTTGRSPGAATAWGSSR